MQPSLLVLILTHCILGLCSLLILAPLLWVLRTSFVDKVTAYQLPPKLFFTPTLDNYRTILSEFHFGAFFMNSVTIALTSTVLAVVIGALAAYAIDRYNAGGRAMPIVILATQMMPPIVLVIPFFLIFKDIGLTNSHMGLILAYLAFNLPYVVWLLMSFMKRVPRELDEAALIDGCTPLTAFVRIIVPALLPGIGAATILSFVLCWNEFLFALMLSGQETKTLPVAISSLVTQQGTAIGAVSAATILAMMPMAIIYLTVRRFLIAGLNAGAVKG